MHLGKTCLSTSANGITFGNTLRKGPISPQTLVIIVTSPATVITTTVVVGSRTRAAACLKEFCSPCPGGPPGTLFQTTTLLLFLQMPSAEWINGYLISSLPLTSGHVA